MPWFIKEFAVREKTSFKFQKAVTIPRTSVTPASSLGSTIDFGGYSHVRARVIRQPSGHAGEKGGERMRERAIFTIPNLLSAFRLLPAGLNARWYGKAAAAILFAAVGVHLLRQPSPALSAALIAASQTGIPVSAALYTVRRVRILAREAGSCPCLPADARKGRSS